MASSILNSDDGVISGTSGLKSTGGDDGVLNIQNNGTTAVSVASDGDVGVGTTSPTSGVKLDVVSADSSQQYINVLKVKTTNTGDVHPVILLENNRGSVANAVAIGMDSTTAAGTGELRIRTKNSGGTFNASLVISGAGNLQFNSGYGSVATAYGCRAWVNFNGSGTVAILEDGNVSSIADNGVGQYTVNFTTAMPDANYQVSCAGFMQANNTRRLGVQGVRGTFANPSTGYATGSVQIGCAIGDSANGDAEMADTDRVGVAIFR